MSVYRKGKICQKINYNYKKYQKYITIIIKYTDVKINLRYRF